MNKYLILKKANITDLIQTRFWRNDYITRNNSFNKNYINQNEHARWFFDTLFNNQKKLFIARCFFRLAVLQKLAAFYFNMTLNANFSLIFN